MLGNITTLFDTAMEHLISAADANRNFSVVLREVREGASYVVTNYGKPVARIVPAGRNAAITSTARELLLRRLATQDVSDVGRWSRDELYEDEA
ncbi:MAG: type II toxin-antitoxin system prevent-host-death family antitoxin [Pseudomonadales bacterium]|jgi:prevent-host-death family protein|nr:type II toxin-antitoxin system prevent-host-death family antitoxin [Pseudomonadales bacterium]